MTTNKKKPKVWVAVVGFTLADGSRVEPGEVFKKPPKWTIEQGKVTENG